MHQLIRLQNKIIWKKVEELEKLETIRKDNKEVYKLKIINPNITTKAQNLVYNLEDLVL